MTCRETICREAKFRHSQCGVKQPYRVKACLKYPKDGNKTYFDLSESKFVTLADPITALVLLGVAVTVIVADECYKAYQRHKIRKASDRELGITPADRRAMRRMERERQREEREAAREWQRRMRERRRLAERLRRHGWEGVEIDGDDQGWDEIREGIGLPEYSAEPKNGDRPVAEGWTVKKRGFKSLFKSRKSDSEPGRKRRWFRRQGGGKTESPPPYSD